MEENNSADIELAFRSLQYIQSLNPGDIPAPLRPKVRDVIANLCDFQYRFARPMELPFDLGNDMTEVLPMPRPLELLLKYDVAIRLESKTGISLSSFLSG